jgi:hypothetical protein
MTIPENRDFNPPMVPSSAMARIDAALEAKPSVQVPETFAATIAALAVAQGVRPFRRASQIGTTTALLLAPLVAAALFALAPHVPPNVKSLMFDTEVILVAQLAIIGWWLARVPGLHSPLALIFFHKR